MELEKLRKEIDKLDAELIQVLNRRVGLALRTRGLKTQAEDPLREQQVLDRIRKKSPGVIRQKLSETIYMEIMKESRNLQGQDLNLIGFQGEHGAYSEVAARMLDTNGFPIPHLEFSEIFDGVKDGQLDMGIVPVENSLAGSVSQVADLLIQTDLNIIGEVKLPIHHTLLTLPDTDYQSIKTVYSHPQAIAQCRGFLARNRLTAKPYFDTAGAAMMLTRERPDATAVIASNLCAELYDLKIIKDKIEDRAHNYTRFVVLSREPNPDDGDKCSLAFSTIHKAGSLFNVLKYLAEENINITRIESRPILDDPGNYAFLLDLHGSMRDERTIAILEKLKEETVMYKFLGCYKEAEA